MARRTRNPPGDYVIDPENRANGEMQPLSIREQELLRRAELLYEDFREKLTEQHEDMRRARLMRQLRQDEKSWTAPLTNTLNSSIDNVIADQIDNTPEALLIPEREETASSAEEMSDIVSYILYQSNWNAKYYEIMEDAAVTGSGIAQVFWDDDAENGDGMVSVMSWRPEDFYPDPMYQNLQDGRGCFKATATTVGWLAEHYPHAAPYIHEDRDSDRERDTADRAAPGDEKCTLLEFWYKRYDAEKRKNRVHMCLCAGGALLFSTETGFGVDGGVSEYREGVYAHGQYPFVMFKFRDAYHKAFGTGLVYEYKGMQDAINRYIKYIDDNARASSKPRHFVRKGSGVTPEDVADLSKTIIEWEGADIREAIQTVQAAPLNNQVSGIMNWMVDSIKQDCGQNQFSRGEGGFGVTAASAIQSLIEAGGKISRWHTAMYKEAFRDMVEQILWVMSEYITKDRKMRIVGGWNSDGSMRERMVELKPTAKEGDKLPKPAYTVRVQVQKANPLEAQKQNELVLQAAQMAAQAGSPLPAESVIRLLKGYNNKGEVIRALREADQTAQMLAQAQAQVEELAKRNEAQQKVIDADRRAMSKTSGQQNIDYAGLFPQEEQ